MLIETTVLMRKAFEHIGPECQSRVLSIAVGSDVNVGENDRIAVATGPGAAPGEGKVTVMLRHDQLPSTDRHLCSFETQDLAVAFEIAGVIREHSKLLRHETAVRQDVATA